MTWYEQRPNRLAQEQKLLRSYFPRLRFVKEDGLLRARFSLRGRKANYQCELVYPDQFPWAEITTKILSPPLKRSPHQFSTGELCTHEPEDVSPETTAVVYLNWLRGWIERYEEYIDTRKWRP